MAMCFCFDASVSCFRRCRIYSRQRQIYTRQCRIYSRQRRKQLTLASEWRSMGSNFYFIL